MYSTYLPTLYAACVHSHAKPLSQFQIIKQCLKLTHTNNTLIYTYIHTYIIPHTHPPIKTAQQQQQQQRR